MTEMRQIGLRWLLALLTAVMGSAAGAEQLVDPGEVEQWADEYYGRAIEERRSAGITVSVVQDGEVVFAKGYGYADYSKRIPVDPQRSGFIVGSITKTFIATAIGQLIDRGAIASFDDPANRYLKRVQLPGERGARVTIRHLLTHRAGFEDGNFGYLEPREKDAPLPLPAAEIERFMPKLVRDPGGPVVYSNWSFSLLGFLIEDVTGQRIDAYLKEHIWDPLGMTHTSMMYGTRPANLSVSYRFEADGTLVAEPQREPHPWIAPAGTIVSTAGDMARYMNAHLFEGGDSGSSLLSREMFKELHTEEVRNAPISIGFAKPFFTTTLNGAPTIEHGGGAPGFQSMMVMIPAKRFGFFVSAMQGGLAPWAGYSQSEIAAGRAIVRKPPSGFELRESFVDRFLERASVPSGGRQVDPGKLVGKYWTLMRPFTSVEALGEAFSPASVLTIELAGDGQGLLLNGAGPYTQLGDGVFASPTGSNEWTDPYAINLFAPAHIAFDVDEAGHPRSLVPGLADQVWKPASPIFNPRTMLLVFLACGVFMVTGVLLFAWPQRRRFLNRTNYLALGLVLGVLVFPYAIMGGFAQGDSLIDQLAVGDRTRLWVMVLAANAMVLLAVVFAFDALRECTRTDIHGAPAWARWGRRVHLGSVAVSSLVVLVALEFFNLIGIHLPG